MTKLYHKDVYLPQAALGAVNPGLRLRYGRHAIYAFADEGLKASELPATLLDFQLVEAELDAHGVTKTVVRIPWNSTNDLVLVVQPDGFVRTVWFNEKTDTHRTLNTSRYARQ
jgi:predicted FMN-binding regulatory protein PaiB